MRDRRFRDANLNWYIVEQLPVIAPERLRPPLRGGERPRSGPRPRAAPRHTPPTTWRPFARDLGYDGPPFLWDEEERRHLRARLDACYFHLYGLGREDADYVLSTFPIVRREDEARFGSYRTRDLVLAYMNALAAGDTETVVAV